MAIFRIDGVLMGDFYSKLKLCGWRHPVELWGISCKRLRYFGDSERQYETSETLT
jgi:hypothetical protein